MNIVLVGIEDEKVKNLTLDLSAILQFPFIDTKKCFDDILLSDLDQPIAADNDNLLKKESTLVSKLSKLNNVVIYMPNDVFLSNKNYLKLKNSHKICITHNIKNQLMLATEQAIKKQCDLCFESNKKILKKLVEELKKD